MKLFPVILFTMLFAITCQTTRWDNLSDSTRADKPVKGTPMFVAPDEGLQVRSAPGDTGKSIAEIPKNTRVRVLDFSRDPKATGGRGQWAKIEFERNSEIITGWVINDFLSRQESPESGGKGIDPGSLKRDTGPAARVTGKFVLVQCEYNPGYSANPYFFLGPRKQFLVFNDDNTCAFDVNNCSGSGSEEGTYSQGERTITAALGRERVLIDVINNNSLRVTKGAGFLSCHVCRELLLVRAED